MVAALSHQVYSPQEAGRLVADRRQRERIGIEEAAAALSMPVRQLRAMEEGDFSIFAAEVYARGAYVRYAVWLGIARSEAERVVLRAVSSGRVATVLKVYTPHTWLDRWLTPRTLLFAIGMGIVVSISGYIVWQLRSFWQLPALAVVEPADAVVHSSEVVVRGTSEADAQISVNGETVLLTPDHGFEVTLHLHPGINPLHIEAKNVAGRVHTITRDLLRPRS